MSEDPRTLGPYSSMPACAWSHHWLLYSCCCVLPSLHILISSYCLQGCDNCHVPPYRCISPLQYSHCFELMFLLKVIKLKRERGLCVLKMRNSLVFLCRIFLHGYLTLSHPLLSCASFGYLLYVFMFMSPDLSSGTVFSPNLGHKAFEEHYENY